MSLDPTLPTQLIPFWAKLAAVQNHSVGHFHPLSIQFILSLASALFSHLIFKCRKVIFTWWCKPCNITTSFLSN